MATMTLSDPALINQRVVGLALSVAGIFLSAFGWILAFSALRYFIRVLRGGR